jgi:hypothetical protein
MVKHFLFFFVCIVVAELLSACSDNTSLAESSFGKIGQYHSKASSVSVISMGRDDDDGKAKKWHIGGGWE